MRRRKGRQKLGQHFLIDTDIIGKIIEAAEIGRTSQILEIGPGGGSLTERLYGLGSSLTLVEPDLKLAERLKKTFPKASLITRKVEQVDFAELPNPLLVISNLPYYASVRIFKHCIKQKSFISRMVLMFQKEVGERISSEPGRRSYGSLSVLSRYHWVIEKVITVSPESFKPPPKVNSIVLRFNRRSRPPVEGEEDNLFRLVRAAFAQKRRMLRNNLKDLYSPESLDEALAASGLDERVRAEVVSLEAFAVMLPILKPL